jgi:hypothetical protein
MPNAFHLYLVGIVSLACASPPANDESGPASGGTSGIAATGGASSGSGGVAGSGIANGGSGNASGAGAGAGTAGFGSTAGSGGSSASGQGGAGGSTPTGGAGGGAAGNAGQAGAGAGGSLGGFGGGAAGGSGMAGSAPSCTASLQPICEDFEGTAGGQIPSGWTKAGSVEVVTDQAFRGTHSLRVNAATNGARRITRSGAPVTALGGAHWGRIYYRVQTPTPGVFVHSTLVAGSAMSPRDNISIEVRPVDTVQNADRTHQFLYNVQPNGRAEFGKGSSYNWRFDDAWHCAEWHLDYAAQSYSFYLDNTEITQIRITNGAGNFVNSEIPQTFQSLSFGWNNYQAAAPGFVAWIDEIAVGPTRIGCGP